MSYPKVSELKVADLQAHLGPNVFGVVWLYQATLPLLRASDSPKWATMGSNAGKLAIRKLEQIPVYNAAYGPSKAAVHWLTIRINAEEDFLTAFVIHPGFVQTEMGNNAARTALGIEKAALGVDESCDGIVKVIDAATKGSHGGRFWDNKGNNMVVLISGGGRGMGINIVESFAVAGAAHIIILDRSTATLSDVAERLRPAHPSTKVTTLSGDVAVETDVARA
ncbi:aflatoxin biosynthesis ketoreductase nor-1 [Diaporthe helianthi]|uniref:Aflatoxin biosynthesis ketoreductase nor-1 n=1 Tax=Diaporthe helianthi TaxID=158607 RepID=A0A2P5HEI7_DIAHE|nr:aflatoxin biosynthesis ketoreductase nor-1 [Diaporthe helianthi]